MRWLYAATIPALLAACGSQETNKRDASDKTPAAAPAPAPTAAEPDLAACPARELLEEGLRERTAPIPVPAEFETIMRADIDNLAFVTLDGNTVCVDASWMEAIEKPALSADGRFASFDWGGYESFGHVIVERSGKGQVVDTGIAPVSSPSGAMLAAADLGEAGYGALNAFAVWRIDDRRLRQLAKHEEVPPAYDWRIEHWVGERCVELSAVAWETFAGEEGPREPYHARSSKGWRVEPGPCPGR